MRSQGELLGYLAFAGVVVGFTVPAYFRITEAVVRFNGQSLTLWGHAVAGGLALVIGVIFAVIVIVFFVAAVGLAYGIGWLVRWWRRRGE